LPLPIQKSTTKLRRCGFRNRQPTVLLPIQTSATKTFPLPIQKLAAFLGGSQVLGVVPKALAKGDIIGKIIREELQVSTMSDAFIAFQGGLDTLEEIFHISPWAQLHIHHKPIGLLNVNGFYDNLLSFLDQAVEQEFLTSSARQIIIYIATAEQLIDQLQSFIHVLDPSMRRINWSTMKSHKKLRLDLSLRL
jgi:hypothetical protein